MSQDFQKVLVKDDRLMVTDSVKYAVIKGGSNMTCSQYNAISQSPSNITFNIQVPSQETIISRNALIRTTLTFSVVATPFPVGVSGATAAFIDYGNQDAFGPFPLNQCVNSVQWTINNNTVSQNTREILPILTRIHDKRWLARYNGMTPTMFDTYGSYNDAVGNINNPNGNFQAYMGLDNDLLPRGIFPVGITGSAGNDINPGGATAQQTAFITITITEPVLVSPWTFAGDESCGMYGIQNLNAVYNLSALSPTAFRMANCATRFLPNTGGSIGQPVVTLVGVNNTQLLLQFLTPHPSDLMPSRNCLPYYELPRYLTTNLNTLAGAIGMSQSVDVAGQGQLLSLVGPAPTTGLGTLPQFSQQTIVSQSLQLNQIPDKLYISCQLPPSSQFRSPANTDSFLSIAGISINWNNSSGLLSSATQQDLWRMSVENGSNQNWLEFQGFANGSLTTTQYTSPTILGITGGVFVPVGTQNFIQTAGSVLILEFGKDIELKDDYYAPGSLGNFQLQFNLIVYNSSPVSLPSNSIVLQTIVQNSGVFSLERGVASSYLGILTKADVLEASREKPYAYSDAIRMVGGKSSFFNRLATVIGKVAPKLAPIAKEALSDFKASKGMGISGGGVSGGRSHRKVGMGALEDRLY